MQLFELVQMLVFTEKHICLVKHDALKSRQIKLAWIATFIEIVVDLAKGSDYNMNALCLTRDSEISDIDVGVLAQFGVDIGDLGWEFTEMRQDQNLRLHNGRVYAQSGSDCESSRLAWTILALGNQIVMDTIDRICYHGDGDSLDVTWLDEA